MNGKLSKHEFIAELRPHRSLGKQGFYILMGFVSFSCVISGIAFAVMGAWPVMIFLLLDVVLLGGAFLLNYRSGRIREKVFVGRDEVKVQKIDPVGRIAEFTFNPFWTRFVVKRHEEIGITSMQLATRDRELEIGSFLNPCDRESFARAFGSAISRARG